MSFKSKFNLNDIVTLNIGETKIRWCSITAVKFEERSVKYDILTQGHKLYDVSEHQLESIEKQASDIAEGELGPSNSRS